MQFFGIKIKLKNVFVYSDTLSLSKSRNARKKCVPAAAFDLGHVASLLWQQTCVYVFYRIKLPERSLKMVFRCHNLLNLY